MIENENSKKSFDRSGSPGSDQELNRELNRKEALDISEQVAKEVAPETSNGNRTELEDDHEGKSGSAQRGGPDLEKAKSRQPPEATRPFEDEK